MRTIFGFCRNRPFAWCMTETMGERTECHGGDYSIAPAATTGNSYLIARRSADAGAMSSSQRWWRRLRGNLVTDDDSVASATSHRQYTLKGSKQNRLGCIRRLRTCNGVLSWLKGNNRAVSVGNPNEKLAASLHWAFRVNFLFLFFVMCIAFFVLVILFAGFIASAGVLDSECVRVGSTVFNSAGAGFADAFALSWTTLSTVGYGSTYPALSHQNENKTNCFYINFICSIESLMGVLYSGFCGAILFGKVLRIQSHAQVIFSDPILLRYGSGVTRDIDEHGTTASAGSEEVSHKRCPVLEFRVVNRLFNEVGGEIMDASLNVVANVDANDADPSLLAALEGGSIGQVSKNYSTANTEDSLQAEEDFPSTSSSVFPSIPTIFKRQRQFSQTKEDVTTRLIKHKHIFSKLAIDAPEHPFFKRCWVVAHHLDEHSPIVKPRVRRMIRKHGGCWPDRLNNPRSIRDSLQFNQILVSLNGVSNISASDVYAQKI